jgi:hypothetical protein
VEARCGLRQMRRTNLLRAWRPLQQAALLILTERQH